MPRIALVVNGGPDSPMAQRAWELARRWHGLECRIVHRTGGRMWSVAAMLGRLLAFHPQLCCVFDCVADSVLAVALARVLTSCRVILDTGDAIVELGRALGRGPILLGLTRALEVIGFRIADRVVVRGEHHRNLLRNQGLRAEWIPDGVCPEDFQPAASTSKKAIPPVTLGVVGSCTWSPRWKLCYGWELVETLSLLPPDLANGVFIGDGDALPWLKREAERLGVADRVQFLGRVSYHDLSRHLAEIDIALSTQTNDRAGQVRTTGKLPLYLAAGRFVLATRVGTAGRILPEEMLVDYHGSVDRDYPRRLAERVVRLVKEGVALSPRSDCVELARRHFDYDLLAPRYADLIWTCLRRRR
ncbi:MAG: glycosyltransferase [Gemmatales bacterium]|nr:glycosyltransferase [Gemmatales bacterium]MDW8385605.1 glycosyltransferase [Gemmatales bacterium]